MNSGINRRVNQPDPAVVRALSGLDAAPEMTLANRTRWAVRNAAVNFREDRRQRRKNMGVTLLLVFFFLTLLTPVLWGWAEELFAGSHLADLSPMTTLLGLTLLSAVVAALVAGWQNRQHLRDGRRNF